MFYIALCDDNKIDLQILSAHLQELTNAGFRMEILPLEAGYELVELYKRGRRFDLLILDMCMEPINGIRTAEMIREYDSSVPIIIVTATMQYALEGYKVNACRYLLKPVDRDQFLTEVKAILNHHSKQPWPYYIISNKDGITKVKIDDIYYFESNMRTIKVHTKNQCYEFTGKISDIAEQMEKYGFIRIHKSFVVNLKHVTNIFKGVVTMEDSTKIFVSKYRIKDVYHAVMNYTALLP